MITTRPTVAIVDDATVIRRSFPLLMPELDVVASFNTAAQLIDSGVEADLVVLEVQHSEKNPDEVRAGVEGLRDAVAAGHRVCVYTQEHRPFVHAACLASGAQGVVSKAQPLPTAQQAFLAAARGATITPAGLIQAYDLLPANRQLTIFNGRERAVLSARARHLAFSEIAVRLDLSEAAVIDAWHTLCASIGKHLQTSCLDVAVTRLGLDPTNLADLWPACRCRGSNQHSGPVGLTLSPGMT